MAYVAYSGGGPAQAALLGNQVTAGISGYAEFAEQIKAEFDVYKQVVQKQKLTLD